MSTPFALLERETEIALLEERLDSARRGGGTLTIIEGPSGIGKSLLLDHARTAARRSDMQLLEASGAEFERDHPFGIVRSVYERWAARATPAELKRLRRGQGQLAAPLLDQGAGAPLGDGVELSVVHGLYWCAVNLSEIRPAVLVVDDVQWADPSSLRALNYLVNRLDGLPLAVVVASRPIDHTADPQRTALLATGHAVTVSPAPLTNHAVRALLAQESVGTRDDPAVARQVWRVTGGNPFLVAELITASRNRGVSWLADSVGELDAFAPRSVRRRILGRLASLGADAYELACAVAILGDDTPLEVVARLAGVPADRAAPELDQLISEQILAGGDVVRFRHPMVGAAVRDELPPGRRAIAHTAAARVLREHGARDDVVALHLLAGVPIAEPWVVDILTRTAQEAIGHGTPDAAVRYLRFLLRLCTDPTDRARVLVELALAEAASGAVQTAVELLEQTVRHVEHSVEQAGLLSDLGQALVRTGRYRDAATVFGQGADLARHEDPELAMQLDALWIFTAYYLDEGEPRALERLRVLRADVGERPDPRPAERLILGLGALQASLTDAEIDGAALASLALGGGVPAGPASSMSVVAVMALIFGHRLAEAGDAVDQMMTEARRTGHRPQIAEAVTLLACLEALSGDLTQAVVHAQQAVDSVDLGWYALAPMARGLLAQCLVARGDDVGAEAALAAGQDEPGTHRGVVLNTWGCLAAGHLAAARGQHAQALDLFLEAGRSFGLVAAVSPGCGTWRSDAAAMATLVGEHDLAHDLAHEELAVARRFGLPRVEAVALMTIAGLAGRPDRLPLLRESVDRLEGLASPVDLARAFLALGVAEREAGHAAPARAALSRAMDLAHRSGALALSGRARDELLASGARPRRPVLNGVGSLTPTELRIARAATEGLNNREIAEEMFLAKSTVAWHLRHVFQKLSVESRDQLVDHLSAGHPEPSRTVTPVRPDR